MIFVSGSILYLRKTNYTTSMAGLLTEMMMNQRRQTFTKSVKSKLFTAMTQGGIQILCFLYVTRYARRIASNKLVAKQLVYIEWKKLYVDQSVNNIIYT